MINVIVDENIAFSDKVFNQFGNVKLLPGGEISNSALKNTDVLIVRSITNVNQDLLKNTNVKFVGTATIGTDHIDLDYLNHKNIFFADAKGCNAYSVAEYVVASLLNLAVKFDFSLKGKSVGIVGVGNVGSKVAAFTEALGMNVLLNDPPLQRSGDKRNFVEIDEILNCDVISLHTPLNLSGLDKTYHLFNIKNLSRLKDGTILINTSRGAVINNKDLLDVISNKRLKVVLDVWENEPNINIDLLKETIIGTPHIAGYSYEGKVNGTKMIYESLCKFLGMNKTFSFELLPAPNSQLSFNKSNKIETGLDKLVSSIYSINDDDERMRKIIKLNEADRINYFDLMRKSYPERREFNNYTIESSNLSKSIEYILKNLRFKLFT
ncbi:MAG: 4-phosphoerythronate dehydrogenase [Ignavibacterium sp.]|jgi:erythronate-4-phosphate dehydrogenase|nr:4-phosphoerythronate dehydrogenase [Ignavibacterium sp.]